MNGTDFNAAYTAPPYYGVPPVKISQYTDICPVFLSERLMCGGDVAVYVFDTPSPPASGLCQSKQAQI